MRRSSHLVAAMAAAKAMTMTVVTTGGPTGTVITVTATAANSWGSVLEWELELAEEGTNLASFSAGLHPAPTG